MSLTMRWIFVIILFPVLSLAQTTWDVKGLSDHLMFSIPETYKRIDTLGGTIYVYRNERFSIQVERIPQP